MPSAGTAEHLTAVDSAWLKMDEPSNLMVINGVLVLDEPITRDELAGVIEERLLSIPRFRQRIACDGKLRRLRWEEDADFDLDHHLFRCRLGPPGGQLALQRTVSNLMGAPFDPAHPLWHFHLIEGYDGRAALMVRLHHCMGDGIAMMLVLLSMADPAGRERLWREDENPFRALFSGAHCDLARVRHLAERLMPEGMRLMLQPAESLAAAGRWLKGVAATTALGRLALRPPDPRTALKGRLCPDKKVAWSRAVPVGEVRRAGHALGATVNDVIVAAVAGGLRRYLLARGEAVPPRLAVRAAVPVNLRALEGMDRLGNQFGLVFLALPVGVADPVKRVAAVHRRMHGLRASAEPLVTYGILKAMGRAPLALQRGVVSLLAAKTTAVMTNVPGPRTPLDLAGKTIRDIFFWVPQAGRVGLGISIMSYAGSARLGVGTDAGLVPDPERIVQGFEEELTSLLEAGHVRDASWIWGRTDGAQSTRN